MIRDWVGGVKTIRTMLKNVSFIIAIIKIFTVKIIIFYLGNYLQVLKVPIFVSFVIKLLYYSLPIQFSMLEMKLS